MVEDAATVADDAASNLEPLHGAKMQLDDMIESAKKSGNRSEARALTGIKESLLKQMDDGSDAYKEGRRIYARYSKPLDIFDNSELGKIAKMGDVTAETVDKRVFGSMKAMRRARATLNQVDPSGETFNQLHRAYIERRIRKVMSPAVQGADDAEMATLGLPGNTPAKLVTALFGNKTERDVIRAALPTEEMRRNFTFLEDALRRAATGRPGGSPTAPNQVAWEQILRGGFWRRLAKEPIDTLASVGQPAVQARQIRAAAEAVYNPRYAAEVANARKIASKPLVSARIISHLLSKISAAQMKDEQPEATLQIRGPQGDPAAYVGPRGAGGRQ